MLESEYESMLVKKMKAAIIVARLELPRKAFAEYKSWVLNDFETNIDIKKLFKQIEAEYPWN